MAALAEASDARSPSAFPSVTLSLENLSGGRGGTVAFAGATLSLAPSEAAILKGPNGAGKTTLLRTIAGLSAPLAGRIDLTDAGGETRAPSETAVFAGHLDGVKPTLAARDNARFWAQLYGRKDADAAIAEAFDALNLKALAGRAAGALSAGQRRRLGLARVLIADRPLWLLDEPTASMDAGAQAAVARLIENHCARGGNALIATHDALALPGARIVNLSATS